MTEELAFDEAGAQGGTVYFNQRPVRSLTGIVNGPGDEFFPGAGFPENQYRGIAGGHLLHIEKDIFERVTLADNLIKTQLQFDFFLEVVVVNFQLFF